MLVLLDIDGTLLNNDNKIDSSAIEAIQYYSLENQFVLCSARKPSSLDVIAMQLHLKEKITICYNGALIIKDKQIIFERLLVREDVRYILQLAKKYKLIANIYSGDLWFVNDLNSFVIREAKIINENPIVMNRQTLIGDLPIHKILLLGVEKNLKLVKNELSKVKNVLAYESKKGYLEITSCQASKKNAFEYLSKYLCIDLKNSLAIGDGYNDLEMLEYAGIGVAMGNAPNEVKQVADYVTYSNEKRGVEYALNKFLGKQYIDVDKNMGI